MVQRLASGHIQCMKCRRLDIDLGFRKGNMVMVIQHEATCIQPSVRTGPHHLPPGDGPREVGWAEATVDEPEGFDNNIQNKAQVTKL
ncbi:hypothetical protein CTI12_AA446220 [Artemisia annua]|uniref:Uncharacterized protein n=1 Tax=Artemisia annua TaxID=35608 RepID=A0A2U1LU88_ARTAN|nr:hypothetical protein CTI12_AA446220 [Artemisia annua]